MSQRGSVLIPTGRKLKSYGCMRSLNGRGVHTIIASEYENVPHFSSRYCSESVRLSSTPSNLTAYKDELVGLASRSDVKTIMPVREFDTFIFAKYRDEFEGHVSLVTPPLETLRPGHDRLRLAREAERAGVPFTETRLLSEATEWRTDRVVKSRYNLLTGEYVDSYSPHAAEEVKGVQFLTPEDDPDLEENRKEMGHEPIVQEYIREADKHLYCALWDQGEPLATYQHKQIRKNSWVGGGGVYRISAHSQAVEDAAYDLLSQLNWHGFACIEYVKDATTDEWKFLEINPRIWQSLPEAVRAGADFPYYYWLRALGEPGKIDHEYETGIPCHIAYGEAAHLLSILRDESPFIERPSFVRTMWDIAASCVRHPRFDYIRLDDPGLFLSGIRDTLSTGVTSSRDFASGNAPQRLTPSTDGGTPEK